MTKTLPDGPEAPLDAIVTANITIAVVTAFFAADNRDGKPLAPKLNCLRNLVSLQTQPLRASFSEYLVVVDSNGTDDTDDAVDEVPGKESLETSKKAYQEPNLDNTNKPDFEEILTPCKSTQLSSNESLIIAELLVSHIQRSGTAQKNKKTLTFDAYMEDQLKRAEQSLWFIGKLQDVMSTRCEGLKKQIYRKSFR
ncbi:hypothetical protein DL95DRAFT_410232 [Leptodontidium sp. 2 PMI_412]|nr:hypothetical protein DL95DRAFT_410232 [Leptodontidium sp. 2 PMI_412]